jgi:hypothetical protein
MAKAVVGDCGIDLAQNCQQVFGGISFTWEHDQHLYLRRITSDAVLYGDPQWQRERLCQLAGLGTPHDNAKSTNAPVPVTSGPDYVGKGPVRVEAGFSR